MEVGGRIIVDDRNHFGPGEVVPGGIVQHGDGCRFAIPDANELWEDHEQCAQFFVRSPGSIVQATIDPVYATYLPILAQ